MVLPLYYGVLTSKGIAELSILTDDTLRSGMVAYYSFDRDATDTSGAGNDGTVSGATQATGKLSNGYSFDGVNDYVNLPSGLVTNPDSVTFGGWFNLDQLSGTKTLFTLQGDYNIQILQSGTTFQFETYDGSTSTLLSSTTTASTGTWYHVYGTYDGTTQKLYINGVLEDSDTANTPSSVSATNRLGAHRTLSAGFYYDGKIDEVGIWNRALTSAEVSRLYNSGAGLKYSDIGQNLVAYYSLDVDASDSSGNGNDGTISGTTLVTGKINDGRDFDGVNDAICSGNLLSGLSSFTFNNWVKASTTSDDSIYEAWGGGGASEFKIILRIISGDLNFYTYTTAQEGGVTQSFPTDGAWHMVTATYDGTTMKTYIDGVVGGTTYSQSGNIQSSTESECIGGNVDRNDHYFDGKIDEVGIWNRDLTSAEVDELYNGGAGNNFLN